MSNNGFIAFGVAFALCGSLLFLRFLCLANRDGEAMFCKVCSRCGRPLLESEKARGWCCGCAKEAASGRFDKLHHTETL